MMGPRIKQWLTSMVLRCRAGDVQGLIAEKWRRGPGVLVLCLTLFAPPVAAALFKVWVQHDTLRLGYALTAAEERAAELNNQIRQLDVELAAERSPARLVTMAQHLELVAPSPDQLWRDDRDAEKSRPGSPAVATRRQDRPSLAKASGAEHARP